MNHYYLLFKKTVASIKQLAQIKTRVLLPLLFCVLLLGCHEMAQAQPSNCPSINTITPITKFADWDWTTVPSDPNYCATWLIKTGALTKVAKAPWHSGLNGTFDAMYLAQDYTKAKGWELLRMDMGGGGARAIPYFALYNRYRGIIRTFFYLTDLGRFINGINITMTHSSSNAGNNSGILALSQSLVQSQDYYSQHQGSNGEIISYKPVFTSQEGWVYAEFQAGFDSYAGRTQYSSTALQFAVHAVTISNIHLAGTVNFRTDQEVQAGGFGIGGTAAGAGTSGLNGFLANGQKVLTAFGSDDLTKFRDNFKLKADKTATVVPVPAVQAQQGAISKAVTDSGSSNGVFKKVAGIAGSLGSWFGLIGSIVGVLWPDDSATPAAIPFTPTVSNGTIALKGTITTTAPVSSFTMQIPGGHHIFPTTGSPTLGFNQPYYDCPLGLFNIKNTPQLAKYSFLVYDGVDCANTDGTQPANCTEYSSAFDSYQVSNDLIAVYNAAAGLTLQSVQAAVVAETPTAIFKADEFPAYRLYRTTPLPNFLLQRVYSGEVEVVAANDSLVTYATPFVDLGRFKNEALTAASGSKVYVRIKAELQRKDAPAGTPPIFYVQDYAIQANPTTVASNPRFATWTANSGSVYASRNEPPFSNLASALLIPISNPGTPNAQSEFSSTAPYLVPASNYTSPLVISSLTTISAGQTSFNPASGSVTLAHPSVAAPSLFLSTTGIALGAGFSVTAGTNFTAVTPLQAWRQGTPPIVEAFSGPCSYNSNTSYNPVAYRIGHNSSTTGTGDATTTVDNLTVSPNPTDGIVTIATSVAGEVGAVVVVSDYMGQEIERIKSIPAGLSSQRINLAGKASGIYLIRLISKDKTVTQKVILQ